MTVCCNQADLQRVLEKMTLRAKEKLSPQHEYYGLTEAQLEPVLWARIRQLLTEHCTREHSDRLYEYAFVVNAPLNDTVFMCTPVEFIEHLPQIKFDVAYLPFEASTYMVDFYANL